MTRKLPMMVLFEVPLFYLHDAKKPVVVELVTGKTRLATMTAYPETMTNWPFEIPWTARSFTIRIARKPAKKK